MLDIKNINHEIVEKYLNKGKILGFLVMLLIAFVAIVPVSAQSESYPYAVPDFYDSVEFMFWGDRIPLSIEISPNVDDPTSGTLTFTSHNQGSSRYVYPITINDVDTQSIEVTDYTGEVRTVNVNTQISIQTSSQQVSIPDSYLFVNRNGALSLATTVPAYLTQSLPTDVYFELTQMNGPILTSEYDVSYAVNPADWTNDFYFDHVNMPTKVSVIYDETTENQGAVTFEVGDQSVTYQAVFETIPQVDFRMESTLTDVEDIRYIKANTRIRLSEPSNQNLPSVLGDDLYMFYNKKEGISLATTRFHSSGLASEYDLKAEAVAQ